MPILSLFIKNTNLDYLNLFYHKLNKEKIKLTLYSGNILNLTETSLFRMSLPNGDSYVKQLKQV